MPRIQLNDWLFKQSVFEDELRKYQILHPVPVRIRRALRHLDLRRRTGYLDNAGDLVKKINESHAREAFTSLVFEQALGFKGILSKGRTYSILPEVTLGRRRPDLAIGSFAPRDARALLVGELKGPGANLNDPQVHPSYWDEQRKAYLSPLEQSIRAMESANLDWCVTSNMDEICLVHVSDPMKALRVRFDPGDLHAMAVLDFAFSRASFVGQAIPRMESLLQTVRQKGPS